MTDLRFGLRLLIAKPAFTLLAVVTLALGIGTNTALFSATLSLLWPKLPIVGPERIVTGVAMREGFDPFSVSLLEYGAQRDSPALLSSGVSLARMVTLTSSSEPERLRAAAVTAGYLSTLGVRPAMGRSLSREDDEPGAPAVAMMSYELWQRRFGGSRSVIGIHLRLDDELYTVVGVMPRGFDMPSSTVLWMALRINVDSLPIDRLSVRGYDVVARLAPGATLDQADTEATRLARKLQSDWPAIERGWTFRYFPLRSYLLSDISGRTERALLLLEAAVGFLLLICCANVANLLLVRGVGRQREIAVRCALGAPRSRIIRQLLVENAILTVAGCAGGLMVAAWLLPLIGRMNPIRATAMSVALSNFSIDGRVLVFTIATAILTGLLFGLIPALRVSSSPDSMAALRLRDQRTGTREGRRWLGSIVIVEIATAVVLLVNGSLIVQSFTRLAHVDLGFDADHLLSLEFTLPAGRAASHDERVRYVEDIVSHVTKVPGVSGAGMTTNYPLQALSYDSVFSVEGRPLINPADVPITAHRLVTPAYLTTLGVRLVKGRLLDDHDRGDSLPVVVVTEELARQAWPNEEPLGKRVRRGGPNDESFPWMTVVGVIADVKEDVFNFRINRPAWYLPYAQSSTATATHNLIVRSGGEPSAVASAVIAAVHAVNAQQSVSDVVPMTEHVSDVMVTERFAAALMTTFAAVGVFLAACGLYGVISYSVSQRTGEIGLRIALGATMRDVLALVAGHGALVVGAGLAVGCAVARLVANALSGTLYGVSVNDVPTFAFVTCILAIVSTIACAVPAVRACLVDPAIALRAD
jgi:putative ABC transport system permease protein